MEHAEQLELSKWPACFSALDRRRILVGKYADDIFFYVVLHLRSVRVYAVRTS